MSFQSYIDNIINLTQKKPNEMKNQMEKDHILTNDLNATNFCLYMKDTYQLGKGHAMALWKYFITEGWIHPKQTKIKKVTNR